VACVFPIIYHYPHVPTSITNQW